MIFIKTTFRLQCALIFLAAIFASAGHSQIDYPAASFSDHSLLASFPDSEIVSRQLIQDINYRIILGSLQRTRGQVVPENSERVRGDVSKITYEVSQEFTGADVFQFFREQFEEKNYTELYSCTARTCGSSNFWANDIFRNRILYGSERNQFYMAMRTNTGVAEEATIALYIITRSNRQIYAYVEIVEPGGTKEVLPEIPIEEIISEAVVTPAQSNPLVSLDLLRENRSVVLPSLNFVSDSQLADGNDLSSVALLLQAEPSLRVYLVAHLQGAQTLDVLLRRSATRAEAVKQSLVELGVDGARISAQGVGPLAPKCASGNCEQRIELVLQ